MRDYLKLHLVIVAWGFTAVLGKLITLPPVEVVVWRTALAALGFAIVAQRCKASLNISNPEKRWMLILGGLLGLHWILFFLSARLATASVSLAAMPTAMLWCSILEPWIDGTKRWRPLELIIGIIMVAAVWMIYEVELRFSIGFSVGLLAALIAAIFAVFNKQQVAHTHYAVMGTYQMIGALIVSIIGWQWMTPGLVMLPSWENILWLALLSSICTVWAYAGYMEVLKRMSVFTVNVMYNMEPIYGILLAALVFGSQEYMSRGFYLGAAIIVGSVFMVPFLTRITQKNEHPQANSPDPK